MDELHHLDQTKLDSSASRRIPEAEEVQNRCLMQSGRNAEETGAGSIEGIWTSEILGPYGWENTGTYVLEQGRILGGNHRHHSAGHYSFVDESYRAEIFVRYHGQPRVIFGQKCEQFEIIVIGHLKDGIIEAQIDRRDRPEFSVRCRMERRMSLPSVSHCPKGMQ